ncbi:MAG: tetratricopeptide repeat protein, partial [Nannocystaceae bacterium]
MHRQPRGTNGAARRELRLLPHLLCASALATPACLKIPEAESDAPATVATAPTTADEVLTRYVAALGGEEALTAVAQRTVEARIDFQAPCDSQDPAECEEGPPPGSFLLVTTADGRMYRRIVVRPPSQDGRGPANAIVTERGFDGTRGWEVQSGPPTFLSIDASADRTRSREDAHLRWFLDYASRGITPELLSSREVDGANGAPPRTLDGVAWKAADGSLPGRSYWFDRRTGLLFEELDQDGIDPDASRTVRYDDYRSVDEVLVPFAITQTTRFRPDATAEFLEDTVFIRVTRAHHDGDKLPAFDIPVLPVPDPIPDPEIAALDAARTASQASPNDGPAGLVWARAAWRLARFDEVLQATEQVLRRDKREPEALWLRARASIMRGEFKAAIKLLERARNAGVSSLQIDQQLGLIDIRKRRFKASATRFRKIGLEGLSARFSSFGAAGLSQKWKGDTRVSVFDNVLQNGAMIFDAVIEDTPVRLLFDSSVASLVLDQQTAIRMLISTDA